MFGAESVKFLKLKLWLLDPLTELCCLFYCSIEAQVAATVPTEAQSQAQGELISGVQQYPGFLCKSGSHISVELQDCSQ